VLNDGAVVGIPSGRLIREIPVFEPRAAYGYAMRRTRWTFFSRVHRGSPRRQFPGRQLAQDPLHQRGLPTRIRPRRKTCHHDPGSHDPSRPRRGMRPRHVRRTLWRAVWLLAFNALRVWANDDAKERGDMVGSDRRPLRSVHVGALEDHPDRSLTQLAEYLFGRAIGSILSRNGPRQAGTTHLFTNRESALAFGKRSIGNAFALQRHLQATATR